MRGTPITLLLVVAACRPAGETHAPDSGASAPAETTHDGTAAAPEPTPSDGALVEATTSTSPTVPSTYDDGAYSIVGLRRDLDARIEEGQAGQEVVLRAYVIEIYVPPECPPGQDCPPPKQPHAWLADDPELEGKKHAMLLANYQFSIPMWDAKTWEGVPDVQLTTGQQYTFRGNFVRFSDTGFAVDNGLFVFRAYRPIEPETGQEQPQWVTPPGAPWHPIEIERQRQQDEMLRKKAERSRRAKQRR